MMFFKKIFIYLKEKESTEGMGKEDSPLSREPDAGFYPRTLGS